MAATTASAGSVFAKYTNHGIRSARSRASDSSCAVLNTTSVVAPDDANRSLSSMPEMPRN